jgi:leucyl-tRNA synthetase
MRNQDAISRTSEESEKEGVWTGRHVRNPFDGSLAQLWVANYALMEYGSGAVMAVPAHDQRDFLFARKYGLPIKVVIQPPGEELSPETLKAAHEGEGVQVASGPFNGISTRAKAIEEMTRHARKSGFGDFTVNYRLKDWLLSRQRYWGAPIPVVYCKDCGIVGVPEKDLPVLLPENVEFRPTGESPLARCEEFMKSTCPKCGKPSRRESDTMDTFVDSSWYFLRYTSPRFDQGPFNPSQVSKWCPVHQYVGGSEHSTMHLIYARFFTKVLHEMGLIPFDEPFERLFCQGMVCKTAYSCEEHKWLALDEVDLEKGTCRHCGRPVSSEMAKMSKTKKNGISPDDLFKQYGADTAHVAILFLGPPDHDIEYDKSGVQGVYRFLRRLWDTIDERMDSVRGVAPCKVGVTLPEPWRTVRRKCHEILMRVTDAFETHTFGFNTCIAGCMEVVNLVRDAGLPRDDHARSACREALDLTVQMLAPFAPHICEELWQHLGHGEPTVFRTRWPAVDPAALVVEEVEIVIQVSGKIRGRAKVAKGISEEQALKAARNLEPVCAALQDKEVVRTVWVQDKLLNIVAR